VFDESGRVTRRLGFDYEIDYVLESVDFEDDEAFTEFVWNNVNGDGLLHFFVQQQGATLHFYDLSGSTSLSANKKSFTVDLNDHIPDSSVENPALYACQYAVSDGDLVVVNPVCEPFSVTFTAITDTITETDIILKVRDFEGVNDDMTLNERPTKSVLTLISDEPEHYYNILNQGWHAVDALTQWDAARTDMPSNADQVLYYRASETDAFDNTKVAAKSPGNTPAPKGHFILDVHDVDRPTAITDDGLSGVSVGGHTQIPQSLGTRSGDFTGGGGHPAIFDSDTTQTFAISGTQSGTTGSIVKTYQPISGGGFLTRISKVEVHGSNDQGYVTGSNPNVTIDLDGMTHPFGIFTNIGTTSFADTADESVARTIASTDTTTNFYGFRVTVTAASGTSICLTEVKCFAPGGASPGLEPFNTIKRPSTVAHLNGRLFYAGIDDAQIGNNVYFTQIIERDEQREKCHQANDPTHEEFADLLSSDGGVIRIPEIGDVKKLFPSRSAILIFANNGLWQVGGSQGAFHANDYVVSRLSSIGTNHPLSFIDYKGTPIWWADDGINTIKYNPDHNSYAVESLTDSTIRSFILSIPQANRQYVKGAYSVTSDLIFWLYNDTEDATPYTYNRVLIMNPRSNSFYPWTISEVEDDDGPVVRGICKVQDALTSEPETIKFTSTVNVDSDTENLTFAEVSNPAYLDWESFVGEDTGFDYTSYFITGYRYTESVQNYLQPNYVFVYLEQEDDASLFMQGVFDWTNSSDSNKWSRLQQCYNSGLFNRDVNMRRLKVRGKGRALQLRFESETGKPFTCIGWSIWQSSNAGI
jgi:hypothetical protein